MRVLKFMICAGLVAATPALAGYKIVAANKTAAVAKSTLTVTPARDWNRLGGRIGRNAESWTLDGLPLNDVTFYGAIPDNTTLFREVDKKNRPLPRFASNMLLPDIAQLFEGSYRVAIGTSLFSVDSIEPTKFAGTDGFRFSYSFAVQDEEVRRKGEANGAIIGGKLYMVTYEAPQIHYYERDIASYRRIVETAVVAAASRRK